MTVADVALLTDCCGTKNCFEGDTKNIDFIVIEMTSVLVEESEKVVWVV